MRRLIAPVWKRIQLAYDRLIAKSQFTALQVQAAKRQDRAKRAARRRFVRRARRARQRALREQLKTTSAATDEQQTQSERRQRALRSAQRRLAHRARRVRKQARRAAATTQFEHELRVALSNTSTCEVVPVLSATQHCKRTHLRKKGSSRAGFGGIVHLSSRLVTGVRWARRTMSALPCHFIMT